MSGITPTGFETRRLQEILAAIDAELRASISEQLDLDDEESVLGQVRAVQAQEISLIWETLADLYRALDPANATGEQLDVIGRFRGVPRLGASVGTGTITASGTPGTVIPAGSRASNSTTGVVVETTADATIGGGGTVTIAVQSVPAGAVVSGVDGIDTIVTPVAGWDAVTGSTELTGSRDREGDTAYRARLAQSTEIVASVEGAIRAALLQVEQVETAIVLSNRTSSTDSNLTPPHSARVVIEPDLSGNTEAEAAIATALFETLPAGIRSYGIGLQAREATILDQQGYEQVLAWEYPTLVPIFVDVEITIIPAQTTLSVSDIEALTLEAVADYINGRPVGGDVLTPGLRCAIEEVLGEALWDIDSLLLDITPSPAGTSSIAIMFNEFAEIADADINVTVNLL